MPDKLAKMQEIADRGLQDKLPPQKRAIFDEAVSRGLVSIGPRKPSEMPRTGEAMAPPKNEPSAFPTLNRLTQGQEAPPMEQMVQERGLPGLVNTQRAVENTPSDAANIAMDMKTLVTDFPEVVQGVGMVAKGIYNTASTGEIDPVLEQIKQAAVDKYGTVEKFQEAFETEPLNTIMLVGGGAGLLGGATKAAGKVAKIPALAKAGEVGLKAGTMVDFPTQGAKAAARMLKPVSRGIMEGVTKFGTTVPKAERSALIETMFKHDIIPNEAGLNKVWNKIEGAKGEVTAMIDEATQAGQTIPKKQFFSKMRETINRAWDEGDMPPQNREQVRKVIKQWNTRLMGTDDITPSQAQQFKQGIYRAVNYDRKIGSKKPMFTEIAKKDMARALKESLEDVPGLENLKHINADEGELLSLVEPLARSVNRIENLSPFPARMGTALGGGTGAAIGSLFGNFGEGAVTGYILGAIAADPKLQARFARLLNRANRAAEKAQTGGAVGVATQQASNASQLPANGN